MGVKKGRIPKNRRFCPIIEKNFRFRLFFCGKYGKMDPGSLCCMDKPCGKSLGLEKLAVGRNDLLPLRGIANSPSTFMV